MISYKYLMPATVFVGKGIVEEKAYLLKKLGKKAFIVTSKFPDGVENICLNELTAALDAQGIEYRINDTALPNPPIYNVDAISKDAIEYHPEFVIGVGGGSPIDVAKAVTVMLGHPGEDTYEVVYNSYKAIAKEGSSGSASHDADIIGFGDGFVPLVTIPTTAGTGAEITHASVLTNERKGTKQSMQQRVFATICFVDYRYCMSCPKQLRDAAAMDALTHGVEGYLNTKGNFMSQSHAITGMKLFSKFKDNMLADALTEEDFENMMIASNVFGFAEMYSTTITHGMGYPLTEEKGVSHGLACAIFLGEFLRGFKDQSLVKPILDACGFNNVDEFADYVNALLQPYVNFTVTNAELDIWTDTMITGSQKWRIVKNPEPLTWDDIRAIYAKSLKKALVD